MTEQGNTEYFFECCNKVKSNHSSYFICPSKQEEKSFITESNLVLYVEVESQPDYIICNGVKYIKSKTT